MLEIRCGYADKSHENTYFNYFASELSNAFEKLGYEGILLGMPECKVNEKLQIDALLITDAAILIIDFKNYNNHVITLPDEADFDKGLWRISETLYVKGGSYPNPYAQLRSQRSKLKDILNTFCRYKTSDFDINHITSMVCFTGEVEITGTVPRKYDYVFKIADGTSFLQVIREIVGVRPTGLLKSPFVSECLDKIFDAPAYEIDFKPTKPYVEQVEERPLSVDGMFEEQAKAFFDNNADVLIVKSADKNKRIDSALYIQELAHESGFIDTKILTSTKMAANNLCKGIDIDGSLYSEIYDHKSRTFDKQAEIDRIPLGSLPYQELIDNDGTVGLPNESDAWGANKEDIRVAFVVCEGQLISNNTWIAEDVIFGSGKLLTDTLEYLGIDANNNGKNKLVILGDEYQLGAQASCLSREEYPAELDVEAVTIQRGNPNSEIEELCYRIADCMDNKAYSCLAIRDRYKDIEVVDGLGEKKSLIKNAAEHWKTSRLIGSTNQQVNQMNLYIKRAFMAGEQLTPEDVIYFTNQFEAISMDPFSSNPIKTIRNGDYARITQVDTPSCYLYSDQGEEDAVATIVPIRFVLSNSTDELQAAVLLEHLYEEKPGLSKAQVQAIKIKLSEIERRYLKEHPFERESNPLFKEMRSEGKFTEIQTEDGETKYRSIKDGRSLTPQERRYRENAKKHLSAPGSEYFVLNNIALARYGWCMTNHKARSYHWDHVVLSADTDGSRYRDSYFRYLYTGLSRAENNVSLTMWRDLHPFEETEFNEAPSNRMTSLPEKVILKVDDVNKLESELSEHLKQKLQERFEIQHYKSSNWREAYLIKNGDKEVRVAFAYGKTGEVKPPTLEIGDSELLKSIREALKTDAITPLSSAYKYLNETIAEITQLTVERSLPYEDIITVATTGGTFVAQVRHGNNMVVTSFNYQFGDMSAFKKVVEQLRQGNRE